MYINMHKRFYLKTTIVFTYQAYKLIWPAAQSEHVMFIILLDKLPL